jgi:hypothetical protein
MHVVQTPGESMNTVIAAPDGRSVPDTIAIVDGQDRFTHWQTLLPPGTAVEIPMLTSTISGNANVTVAPMIFRDAASAQTSAILIDGFTQQAIVSDSHEQRFTKPVLFNFFNPSTPWWTQILIAKHLIARERGQVNECPRIDEAVHGIESSMLLADEGIQERLFPKTFSELVRLVPEEETRFHMYLRTPSPEDDDQTRQQPGICSTKDLMSPQYNLVARVAIGRLATTFIAGIEVPDFTRISVIIEALQSPTLAGIIVSSGNKPADYADTRVFFEKPSNEVSEQPGIATVTNIGINKAG